MKTKLTGDISPILYMIPIGLVFFTLIFLVISTVDEQIKDFYPIVGIFGTIILIIWILFRQCKIVYYDNENIYVHTIFKNKLIKKIDLAEIYNLTSGTFIIKITYLDYEHKKRMYYTFPDRKTMDDELGFSNFPGFTFLYGKPNNRILILKELIKNKSK